MKSVCWKALCAIALTCSVMPLTAATVDNLYDASVPIDRAGREAALQEALRMVAVRASGRRDAAAQLGAALNNPRRYLRFESSTAGTLTAGFDSVSVDKLLADAGLPIWGKERPATVVWLQLQEMDGTSRWLGSDMPSAERDSLMRAADQRGLPLIWPRGDVQEQARLSALSSDSSAALLESAASYGANAALLGRARRDAGGGFSVQWTLASSEGNVQASGAVEEGVHLAADTFARTYSASGSAFADVLVEVSGLGNLDAYAQTLNYLEGLTLVRSVAVEEVAGDLMRFRLKVRGDAGTLQRAISLGNRLSQSAEPAAGDRLAFRFRP